MSLLDPKHAKEVAALLREAKAGLVADTKGLTAEMEAVSGPTTATVGAHTLPIAGFEAKNLVPKEKLKEIAKLKAGDARWPGFNLLVNPGALGRQVGKKLGYEMYEQAPNLHLPEIEKQITQQGIGSVTEQPIIYDIGLQRYLPSGMPVVTREAVPEMFKFGKSAKSIETGNALNLDVHGGFGGIATDANKWSTLAGRLPTWAGYSFLGNRAVDAISDHIINTQDSEKIKSYIDQAKPLMEKAKQKQAEEKKKVYMSAGLTNVGEDNWEGPVIHSGNKHKFYSQDVNPLAAEFWNRVYTKDNKPHTEAMPKHLKEINEALAKSRNGDKSGVKKIFQKLQSDWAVNHQGEKMPDNMMIPVPGVYRSSNSSASISNLKGDSLWMYGDPETDSYDFIEPKHHK